MYHCILEKKASTSQVWAGGSESEAGGLQDHAWITEYLGNLDYASK